jgi:ferritin-like metal-binding protein YciE
MSAIKNLNALLIDELRDLYYAEKHLVKALPKMAKAATSSELKDAFTGHLEETKGHVERLEQAFEILGEPAKTKTCHAMDGLIKEGGEAIDMDGPSALRDADLIGAAQRVEHYEMAAYGTARAFAETLGQDDVAALLQSTLDEEGNANKKLTAIASTVNSEALHADEHASLAQD